ncbi:hypothetical protein Q7P37_010724 [Cladosporium fusiforme]
MVRAMSLAAIQALKNADDPSLRNESLRQLKNSLVGHDQRKELAVKDGIIDLLVPIVAGPGSGDQNGAAARHMQSWTPRDEARLQATLILGSLASGGTAFVPPLVAAGTVERLLCTLRSDCAPRLVTASLQALRNLAASWKLSRETSDSDLSSLGIFNNESFGGFLNILQQSSNAEAAQQQLPLVCDIISLAAQDVSTKSFLTHGGLLDVLAGLLVSYSITKKHIDYRSDTSHLLPCPPVPAIPNILSALSTLISGSTYRAHRFILAESVRDMFLNFAPGDGDLRYLMGPKHGIPNASGSLLPPLHIPSNKSVSFGNASNAFPVLGGMNKQNGTGDLAIPQGDIDHANAVCSWLLYFVRSFQGPERLQALRLMAMVNESIEGDKSTFPRHEFAQKSGERERQLNLLAVPLAVRLVQDSGEPKDTDSTEQSEELATVRESACDVLAQLIACNRNLQTAAVDAGAIKHVCPVLRKSFDNVPLAKPMWPARRAILDEGEKSTTCQLGSKGLPLEILHAMRCRQGALEALAAIAQEEDAHRKAIVEAGVVTCIIDSLKPFPLDLQATIISNKGQLSAKDGNTTAVVLAACRAAKSMSRSVSLLRTSLIDGGIAKPIFELLKHPNVEVQIGATNVCANLLLDFSPMREDLMALGVIHTLCDHARRSSPALRLSSLWALKHLMLKAPKEMKIDTVQELGTGWLVSAIAGEYRDTEILANGGGVSVGLSSSNAAGEQVDLLNPSSMDVDEPSRPGHDDDFEDEDEDEDGEIMYDEPSNTHYQASQMRSTLAPTSAFNTKRQLYTVRESEENSEVQARREDIAIQEQALDFLRNLFHGDECAEMVEYVFRELGHQKVFDLITAKLSPLPTSQRQQSTGGASNSSNGRQIYNPTQLVLAAARVITHIANGSPQHKQLLIAQRPLLQAWLPHFSHHNRQVRVNCVWAVNSLTWIEDERDRSDARQRTQELRDVGIEHAVRGLASDSDLDVRERVKTAQADGDMKILPFGVGEDGQPWVLSQEELAGLGFELNAWQTDQTGVVLSSDNSVSNGAQDGSD